MIALWFVLAMCSGISAQAVNNCLNDVADFNNPSCAAKDVKIAALTVVSGPASCVLGSTIQVQLQAKTVATAKTRYDVGYWVALDGGDAITGECFRDYLPPL